ncbi:MAG: DMT family transporter [Alphaproteobacteria bacterium]|nr:DMT family transporter [Alphaproteobacteria bacterium]MBU1526889.1 DMT family transporter [Alphaproteobacteria bacterium]MBU2351807.1 DMT family transporter [Alphaproteobacteria bacterium]MBU2381447.1 DMT family transporter [Alphaproteobacteria bacterium]
MDVSPADRRLALIVLLGAAVVLGLAPILVRLGEVGPAAAGMWRFAFSLPLLLILTARPGAEGVGRPSKWMALAGLFFVLDLGFWHYGIVMTSVANATTLCNLTPVVVTAFAWVVWGERPSRMFLVALALAMAGAFAMAAGADGGQGSNPLLGDLFSLSVALWYAGYFLAVQAARRTAGAMRVTLWATGLGLPLLLGAAVLLKEDLTPETAGGWAALAGLGVMHVVGQGGVAWALGRLPASVTAVTILVQPVVAAILGWILFAEALTPVQALGGALVLGAVVLAQRSRTRTATA